MNHPNKILRAAGLRPKRALGQNFLIHAPVAERIAALLLKGVEKPCPMLEIGAGLGALTRSLIPHGCPFVAVEKDKALAAILQQEFSQQAHTQIICQDILDYDFKHLPSQPLLVTGNLPYNIASPLLFKLLQKERQHIKRMVLMFQKEVGLRIMAKPGSKAYGILAILTQLFSKPKLEFSLTPSQFYPPPKISSSVISFDLLPKPQVDLHDEDLFFELAHACLAQRRKTLRNNLMPWLSKKMDKSQTIDLIEGLPIDLKRRGETLSLQELSTLTQSIKGEL